MAESPSGLKLSPEKKVPRCKDTTVTSLPVAICWEPAWAINLLRAVRTLRESRIESVN